MVSKTVLILLSCTVSAVFGNYNNYQTSKKTLVVFGAGYEDNGVNLPDDVVGLHKYSTGKNWPDYVADEMEMKLENWAVAGALTGVDNYYFEGWSGNQWQVDEYLKNHSRNDVKDVLVGFMTGGINEMFYRNYTEPFINGMVNNVTNCLQRLIDRGVTAMFVLNIPDYTLAPGAQPGIGDSTIDINNAAKNGIIDHNKKMDCALTKLKEKNRAVTIVKIDFHTLWNVSISTKKYQKTYGFHCERKDDIEYPDDIYLHGIKSDYKDMVKYAFYDGYHPATAVHYDVSKNITAALKAAKISTNCNK